MLPLLYRSLRPLFFLLLLSSSPLMSQSGPVAVLDGSNDYFDAGNWFRKQTFTIELWVRPEATQRTYADIVDNRHDGGRSWVVQQDGNNTNTYVWGMADGSPGTLFTVPAHHWSHLAFVRDSATFTHYVYLNGVLVDSSVGTKDIFYNDTEVLSFGRWGENDRFWNGAMDDIRIWNTARTATQIAGSFHSTLTGSEPGLESAWNFNTGSSVDLNAKHTLSPMNGVAFTDLSVSTTGELVYQIHGLIINVTAKTGVDTLTLQKNPGAITGTAPQNVTNVHNGTWDIGITANGSFTADLTFGLGGSALNLSDQEHPGNIKLFRREIGSTGAWTLVDSASRASFGTVTFSGITQFGQFAVGTATASPMNGWSGAYLSAKSGTWSDPESWILLGGSDDGIPDIDDDVVIRAGHTITAENTYCNNLLLEGAAVGTRLHVTGSYAGVNGTVNADQTILSSTLITTDNGGYLAVIGEPRVLFGHHWSADVLGWKVYFDIAPNSAVPSLIYTDFKAGEIDLHRGFIQIGTWNDPKNLYLDMGSDNTGSFVCTTPWNFWSGLTVTGNIARTSTLSSTMNSFVMDGGYLDIGGTTISADNITLGTLNRGNDSHAFVTVRSNAGLHFNTSSYTATQTDIVYAGTEPQTTGDELPSGAGLTRVTVRNRHGVEFLSPVGTLQYLTLDSGDVSLTNGHTLIVANLEADTNSITGNGNVQVTTSLITTHPNGVNGTLQMSGTASFSPNTTLYYTGRSAQTSGELLAGAAALQLFQRNPNGLTLSSSLNTSWVVLDSGNVSVNAPDTLTSGNVTPNLFSINGSGTFVHTGNTVRSLHPYGIDSTYTTTHLRFTEPWKKTFLFQGNGQSTGLRMPDTIEVLSGANITLSRSTLSSIINFNASLDGVLTIPSGVTLRTGWFEGFNNIGEYVGGAGNFILNTGGQFNNSQPDGVDGSLKNTGDVIFAGNNTISLHNATHSGLHFPDTIATCYFSSGETCVIDKPFSVSSLLYAEYHTLDNAAHGITMLPNATLRLEHSAGLSAPILHTAGYHVISSFSAGNGNELPADPLSLLNLTAYGSPYSVQKDVTVNGRLDGNTAFDLNGHTITAAGPVIEGGWGTAYVYGPVYRNGMLLRPIVAPGDIPFRLDYAGIQYQSSMVHLLGASDTGMVGLGILDTATAPLPSPLEFFRIVPHYYVGKQNGIDSLQATVELEYPADLPAYGIPDADSLKVMQWRNGAWHSIPVIGKNNTYARNIIAGPVDSLGVFVLAAKDAQGIASYSHTSRDFGTVKTGRPYHDTIVIRNTGTYALKITVPPFGNDSSELHSSLSVAGNPYSIPVGDSLAWIVTYTPHTTGPDTLHFLLKTNGENGNQSFTMTAHRTDGHYSTTVPSLVIGETPVSVAKTDSFFVRNTGTAPLTMSGMHAGSPYFTVSPETLVVQVNDSAAVHVSFLSATEGTRRDTIILPTDAWQHSILGPATFRLPVSGSAFASRFAVLPGGLNYGAVRRGLVKSDSVWVKNAGGAPLIIDSIRATMADYSILPAAASIAVGESLRFAVQFAPVASGPRNGAVIFHHSAASTPDSLLVTGSGIEPIASLNRSSIIFGNASVGDPKKDSVVVTNTGSAPLIITSAASGDTTQFSVAPLTATIAPSASRTFVVTFRPDSMGVRFSRLILSHDAVKEKDTLELSGFGIMPVFTALPRLLNMGEVRVDSSRTDSVEIRNDGNTTLAISAVTGTDPQFVITPTAVNLAPNASKSFAVTFTPKSRYLKQTHFLFAYNGKRSPDTVTVTGVGIEPDFAAAPLHDLHKVRVGKMKTDTLLVMNSGNMPLTIFHDTTRTEKFTITPHSAVVPKEGSFPFLITFTSPQRGPFTDTVVFHHDHYTGTPDTVILKALAVEPLFVPRRLAFDFDSVRVRTQRPDSVWITNPGNMELTISAATVSDTAYRITPAAAVIPEGDSLLFHLAFHPAARQVYNGLLHFTHDADSNPDTLTAHGIGVEPLFFASTNLIDLGFMEKDSLRIDTVTVSNAGNTRLLIDSIRFAPPVISVTPVASVVPLESFRRYIVTVQPQSEGVLSTMLRFHHNADRSNDTVAVTVKVGPPKFTVTSRSLAFGKVIVGKHRVDSVVITNTGAFDLSFASIVVTDSSYKRTPVPGTLPGKASVTLAVDFVPSTGGPKNAMAVFTHNGVSKADTILLNGAAFAPLSIAAARALPDSSEAVVTGVLTRVKGSFSYLQDTTGALTIRQTSGAYFDSVASHGIAMGDKVQMFGRISQFRFLKEINQGDLYGFERLSRGNVNVMPAPQEVTLTQLRNNGELYESELVYVKDLYLTGTTDTMFAAATSYAVVNAADSSKSVVLRIGNAADTDADGLHVPKKNLNVIAVVSQFHTTDSTKGYQLLPVLAGDLQNDPLSVREEWMAQVPATYELYQNFPNPFNPSTTIRFGVPEASSVTVEVYDIIGRRVAQLVNERVEAGYRQVVWHAPVATGVYLYRIESRSLVHPDRQFVQVKKMLLMK